MTLTAEVVTIGQRKSEKSKARIKKTRFTSNRGKK